MSVHWKCSLTKSQWMLGIRDPTRMVILCTKIVYKKNMSECKTNSMKRSLLGNKGHSEKKKETFTALKKIKTEPKTITG